MRRSTARGEFHLNVWTLLAPLALACATPAVRATDIDGVQGGAADIPYIHMLLRTSPTGDPLVTGDTNPAVPPGVYDVQAYLDTGTSGVLLSQETASALNLAPQLINNDPTNPVLFSDVGVGGNVQYNVSDVTYYLSLAPRHMDNDITLGGSTPDVSQFTVQTAPIRLQMATTPVDPNDWFAQPLDIVGMPALVGKVMVVSPRLGFDDLGGITKVMDTYVYERTEGFHPDTLTTNPGIVPVNHHVKLTFADFSGYTMTTPGGIAPTLSHNPIIGRDPTNPSDTSTPQVTLTLNGLEKKGNFLFDSGAQVSFISTAIADGINVRYRPGTQDTDNPILETYDRNNPQNDGTAITKTFLVPVGGVSGNIITAVGFYLDSLRLETVEGDPINFLHAPVAVIDVTLTDSEGHTITLDGDLGINFWGPSFDLDTWSIADSPFDWMVLDEQAGTLGFQLAGDPVPEPTAASVLVLAACGGLLRRRRVR